MTVTIRPATEADQPTIEAIIHAADINPNGLDWRRFLLAEADGQIIGTGQVKPHPDGSRELASIAVIPEWRGKGVAQQIIAALLARENEPLYLMCESSLEPLYARFGFRAINRSEMSPFFRRINLFVTFAAPIWSLMARQRFRFSIMKQQKEA